MKNKSGITLIALIITILVMLILVGVTVNVALNGGLFDTAKEAVEGQKIAQAKEMLIGYSVNYYQTTGVELEEGTIESMAETSVKTGISTDKLVVHYNSIDESQYVLYRIDKTTEEERQILEAEGIKALRGDIDLDGVLTANDVKLIDEYDVWAEIRYEATEIQVEIADIWDDGDGEVNTSDSWIVGEIIYGNEKYTGGYFEE